MVHGESVEAEPVAADGGRHGEAVSMSTRLSGTGPDDQSVTQMQGITVVACCGCAVGEAMGGTYR